MAYLISKDAGEASEISSTEVTIGRGPFLGVSSFSGAKLFVKKAGKL